MAKTMMKRRLVRKQKGKCALTAAEISAKVESLIDTDRITPKADGGTYTDQNTRIVDPVAHMERHGTLRVREEQSALLKSTFDDRVQTMKLLLKINNQLLAYQRRVDDRHPETEAWLEEQMVPVRARLASIDKSLAKQIRADEDSLVMACLAVPGLGPITVAALTVYVNLEKASSPSALWKYVGLHASSGERYTKGEAGGGNKTLRTVLWNTANTLMKMRSSPYREVYDRTKTRLENSQKIVRTRGTKGVWQELSWSEVKPCHRHGAALRAIIKHVLVDYWLTGRRLRGLPTRTIYAEGMLGHEHIIQPWERGWPEP